MDLDILRKNKLVKEWDFIRSDFSYKSEMIRDADIDFLKNVNLFLESNTELKKIYQEKVDIKLNSSIDNYIEDTLNTTDDKEEIHIGDIDNTNPKLRKVYREIVKLTHPDKILNSRLNEIYIEATNYYRTNNIISMYIICDKLGIEYEIQKEEEEMISIQINEMKERISFMETTLTWKWKNENDQNVKDLLILSYIKSFII